MTTDDENDTKRKTLDIVYESIKKKRGDNRNEAKEVLHEMKRKNQQMINMINEAYKMNSWISLNLKIVISLIRYDQIL